MNERNDGQSEDEITALIRRIETVRDEDACRQLWMRCLDRVLAIARRRMAPLSSRDGSEDDVAQSAMKSLFRAVENGGLDRMADREDLWRVLTVLTFRKAVKFNRRHTAQRRGGGKVSVVSDLTPPARRPSADGPEQIADPATDEGFVGQLLLEYQERLDSLPDDLLRDIAMLRMEGYELTEIAERLNVARATVNRKLALVRNLWSDSAAD